MPYFAACGKKEITLALAAAAFIAIYIFFFPLYFASIDEHEYLKNSFLLQKGTLAEPDRTQSCEGKPTAQGYVSQYFIGRSIFLIPFTWPGFWAVMLSGLVIHLLNFLLVILIFRRLKVNTLYSLLYLLYPAFLWESRTLASELLALTTILAAVFFFLSARQRDSVLAGIFLGLAALPRYETALITAAFLLPALVWKRRKFLLMAGGLIPMLLLLLWSNAFLYGGILEHGYSSDLGQILGIGTNPVFLPTLAKFLLLLALVYPLMLLSPAFAPPALRKETALATILYLVFYAQNAFIAYSPTLHPTALTGQLRYLIPMLGLLVLAYPFLFEKIVSRLRLPLKPALAAVLLLLFASAVVASAVHDSFLDGRRAVFDQIYSNTEPGSLLVGSSDDCNYVLNELFEERAYLDVGTEGLESHISRHPTVYVLDIRYGTVDYSSPRGQLVSAERQAIKDYIEQNRDRLTLVFETQSPHQVKIYRMDVEA